MVLAAFRRLSGSGERSELPGVRGGAPRGRAARQLDALAGFASASSWTPGPLTGWADRRWQARLLLRENQSLSAGEQCSLVVMRIVAWDPADPAALAACHEVQRAVQQADDPLGPPKSARVLRTWLSEGWERNPCEAWWAPGAADGTADGWYWMELPDKENLSRAVLVLAVHPRARGGDVPRELTRHAAQRARESGRTLFEIVAWRGVPSDAFWRAMGARPTQLEARRVLDLRKAPPGHFAGIRDSVAPAAPG